MQSRLEQALGKLQAEVARRIYRGELVSDAEIDTAFRGVLEAQLVEIATEEGIRLGETGVSFDPAIINAEMLAWARNYTYDLVKGLTETTQNAIREAMSIFLRTPGMTIGQLEALLEPIFGAVRAEAIAVTEVTRAFSEAQNANQRWLAKQGVIMERVWRTSNDELVCHLICAPLNGKPESEWAGRYPSGPAAHPRCRCSTTLRMPEAKSIVEAHP